MNEQSPNLLSSLFDLFSNQGPIPRENFLSEAFAHVLRESPNACDRWTSSILKQDVSWKCRKINTRPSEQSERGRKVYPDMLIEGMLSDDRHVAIYFEHKWASPFNERQIDDYAGITKSRELKEKIETYLAFVGSNSKQVTAAKQSEHLDKNRIYLWERVYVELADIPSPDQNLTQFLEFMKANGLSPGEPITLKKMQAYIEAAGFIDRLLRYGKKLLLDYEWHEVPVRYRENPAVKDRWGRVAIEFWTPGWSPTITIGFLHSTHDHEVTFTAPGRGIDLMLRIECNPQTNPNPVAALAALADKAENLRRLGARVLLKGDRENGNSHTLLIAQTNLASVIDGRASEREQVEEIHSVLSNWLRSLFEDGKLEPALKTLKG